MEELGEWGDSWRRNSEGMKTWLSCLVVGCTSSQMEGNAGRFYFHFSPSLSQTKSEAWGTMIVLGNYGFSFQWQNRQRVWCYPQSKLCTNTFQIVTAIVILLWAFCLLRAIGDHRVVTQQLQRCDMGRKWKKGGSKKWSHEEEKWSGSTRMRDLQKLEKDQGGFICPLV